MVTKSVVRWVGLAALCAGVWSVSADAEAGKKHWGKKKVTAVPELATGSVPAAAALLLGGAALLTSRRRRS